MVRLGIAAAFAVLIVALVSVPTRAGDCSGYTSYYYGRSASYYPATYYQPVYSAPVYSAPVCQAPTCAASYTPNPYNLETLFKVAPELAAPRINDEIAKRAATETMAQFKAELQAQEATRQREADRARQERLLTSMETALAQQSAVLQQLFAGGNQPAQPAATDPERARMAEEIRQLRAALEQQQQQQQRQSQPPPQPPAVPRTDPQPIPPKAIPPGKTPDPKTKDPVLIVQAAFNTSCLECHSGSKAARMNLSDVARLSRPQLSEIARRLVTPNPKEQMPPPDSGHPSPDISVYHAVDGMISRLPFQPTSAGN